MLICVSLTLFCSQVIENLDTLSSLQSLFLGTNKITKLQNLEGLHSLTVLSIQVFSHKFSLKTCLSGYKNKKLSLYIETRINNCVYIYSQSNRITKIEGLQNLVNLKELYLSHNGIEVIEGLENNVSYRNSTAYF